MSINLENLIGNYDSASIPASLSQNVCVVPFFDVTVERSCMTVITFLPYRCFPFFSRLLYRLISEKKKRKKKEKFDYNTEPIPVSFNNKCVIYKFHTLK